MKKKIIFSIICLFMIWGSYAQELANFMGQKPIISPEFKADEVIFRISQPYAFNILI